MNNFIKKYLDVFLKEPLREPSPVSLEDSLEKCLDNLWWKSLDKFLERSSKEFVEQYLENSTHELFHLLLKESLEPE